MKIIHVIGMATLAALISVSSRDGRDLKQAKIQDSCSMKLLPYEEVVELSKGLARLEYVAADLSRMNFQIALPSASDQDRGRTTERIRLMEISFPEGGKFSTPKVIAEMRKIACRPASIYEILSYGKINAALAARPLSVMGTDFVERSGAHVCYFKLIFTEEGQHLECKFDVRGPYWQGTIVVPVVPLR